MKVEFKCVDATPVFNLLSRHPDFLHARVGMIMTDQLQNINGRIICLATKGPCERGAIGGDLDEYLEGSPVAEVSGSDLLVALKKCTGVKAQLPDFSVHGYCT